MDISDLNGGEERKQLLAAIIESSDDAIISKNLDGIVTSWNKGAEQIFGYGAEEVIGKSITIIIPADRHSEEKEILRRIRSGERIDHFETLRQRKDGTPVTISLTVSPIMNAQGRIVGASKIARDITEQKRAAEKIRLLAREVDHRANNLLATIQAILRLTRASSLEEFKREVDGRIAALAKAHKLIGEGASGNAAVRQLAVEELSHYGVEESGPIRISGPAFFLDARSAQGLTMVLHELATNAAKYGALSRPSGTVSLEWSLYSENDVRFVWTELGGPQVRAPAHRGFGTKLLEGVIKTDLGGALSFDWDERGLICSFSLRPHNLDD